MGSTVGFLVGVKLDWFKFVSNNVNISVKDGSRSSERKLVSPGFLKRISINVIFVTKVRWDIRLISFLVTNKLFDNFTA